MSNFLKQISTLLIVSTPYRLSSTIPLFNIYPPPKKSKKVIAHFVGPALLMPVVELYSDKIEQLYPLKELLERSSKKPIILQKMWPTREIFTKIQNFQKIPTFLQL